MEKILQSKKSVQEMQNNLFKKMSAERKLEILDSFYKFGKELQNLNDRKIDITTEYKLNRKV